MRDAGHVRSTKTDATKTPGTTRNSVKHWNHSAARANSGSCGPDLRELEPYRINAATIGRATGRMTLSTAYECLCGA